VDDRAGDQSVGGRLVPVDPVTALTRLGGCATWGQLVTMCTHHALKRAVARGEIVRLSRGRYVLPLVLTHRREAHRLGATLSHLSAASTHGWPVKSPPDQPWITIRRKRHLDAERRRGFEVSWRDLGPDEIVDGVTSPVRTVIDCALCLPFDEALAVADSALRSGSVRPHELTDAAAVVRGHGAPRARRIAAAADGRAANPFESVLRAICLDIPGLDVTAQLQVTGDGIWAVVDLADERMRLVIEAEGFEFHGTRRGLVRDCRRYTEITVLGWSVLRFTWEDVMFRPDWVRWAITAWMARNAGVRVPAPPDRQAQAAG
jgi:very-short-patch-repair endonuclease